MSKIDVTYLIAGACGLVALVVFFGLILVPAVAAHRRVWQRLAAAALSFYVLAAMIGVGVLAAVGVYELWVSYG